MEQTTEPAIHIEGLRKSFDRHVVLNGIDLTIPAGEIFGYIGPNGSGKTTTVKILTGMLSAFEGDVHVAGLDVRREPLEVKRQIGYVPENAALYESLTVFEFLQLVARLHELNERKAERKIVALVDEMELGTRLKSQLGALSKGMRQKILILSALLHDPDILFLDEPLSGLDVNATILIKELIRALADQGKTIFYCSHLMDVVERVCDRIAILHGGQLVVQGTFEQIQEARSDVGESLESIFASLTRDDGETDQVQRLVDRIRDPS